jgi:Protein of unknown function (DUF3866)
VLEATRSRVQVAIPKVGDAEDRLRRDLGSIRNADAHEVVDVAVPDVVDLFTAHGLEISSMGRPAADDPLFFAAAGAAGIVAATAVQ